MSVLKNVMKVSVGTGVSRILGLVREMVMAHFFGTSTLQSAFVIAFRLPNVLRRLFGEGALGQAFTPVFTEVEQREGQHAAQQFVSQILGLLVYILSGIVCICILFTFGIEYLCDAGSRWAEAMPLMRITLPYAVLICIAAILTAVLNVRGRFGVSALTPAFLNIVWLAVLGGVCPFLPAEGTWRIKAVCWGIVLGGVAQVAVQLPTLRRVGYVLRFSVHGWRTSPAVRTVLLQTIPASFGIGLAQLNICLDGWLAFYGASWAPSALEYADRIIYLPLGLIGTAYANVLLPTYSRHIATKHPEALLSTLSKACRNLMVMTLPMTVGLIVLATPIVALIYQRGAFTEQSTLWTARAVFAYAPGVFVFSINKAIVSVFYARKEIRLTVNVASWCLLANLACNILSVLLLPEDWCHVGLASSTVFSSILNTIILIYLLRKRGLCPTVKPLLNTFIRVLIAVSVMGCTVFICNTYLLNTLPLLFRLLTTILVGGSVYIFLLILLERDVWGELREDLPLLRRLK